MRKYVEWRACSPAQAIRRKVFAGTINQKGTFRFIADKIDSDTMLAQIIRMVQDAQGSKAPVQKLVNPRLAGYVLVQIQQLYRIEQISDNEELTFEQRMLRRQEQALPILDQLEKWMEIIYPKVLPKSRMGQAIAYAYQLWTRMRNYLKDGRLKIDNNLAENAIRPIALSRKNFLFCENHDAAQNTAIICSLLASCKASNVNPREWLTDVIARLPHYTANKEKELKGLLPYCWKQRNSREL